MTEHDHNDNSAQDGDGTAVNSVRGSYRFECEDCNRTWSGESASRCPDCNCGRVYLVKEGGERVPV